MKKYLLNYTWTALLFVSVYALASCRNDRDNTVDQDPLYRKELTTVPIL